MRRSQLPVTAIATCLVAGAMSTIAPSATAAPAAEAKPLLKHVRCSHKANPPRDPDDGIVIGDTTMMVGIKKLRGFHKVREGKRVCVFKRKRHTVLKLSATYRPGTRPKMTKRYFKARKKPGFKLIRFAKDSKVQSSRGKRTVLEYTFRGHGKRRHVRVHGDAQVVLSVSSPQRRWKATKRSATKIRRSMKVRGFKAM